MKEPLSFFLASANPHKAQEFTQLIDPKILIVQPSPQKQEVEESGLSFYENAFRKAQIYHRAFQVPVMSDDSGLNVAALPKELGVHSARFGGARLNDLQRCELLIEKLKDKKDDERQAFFTCVLCFFFGPKEVFFFEGRLEGSIASAPSGEFGFGYDPVFIPSKYSKYSKHSENAKDFADRTLAELPQWKKQNSHRFHACQSALSFFSRF